MTAKRTITEAATFYGYTPAPHATARFATTYTQGTTTFIVESKNQFDVRRPIFFMLAENSWPILSLEYTGASLENIFISVVDEAQAQDNAPADNKKKA